MSIRATSPYTLYLDADGTPLTGGYVYFGVAGSNPETTPIATYWDESLTIAAAQPLRTINGFITRNGSPGTIYTAAAYSVTVKNKNGALVFSALTNPGIPFSLAMLPVCSAATLAAGLTAFGFSAFVQTLINDADAAAFFTTLGISAYIQTLLNDADAATARTTLGAVGLTGDEAVAGIKTFSSTIVGKINEAEGIEETGASAVTLKAKVLELGEWNMDDTAQIVIAHGIATPSKIRDIRVVVRYDDDDGWWYQIEQGGGWAVNDADLIIARTAAGTFDATTFNATGFNRGYATIWYEV